jgi:quercetin dioxygenase-like cupin family protein
MRQALFFLAIAFVCLAVSPALAQDPVQVDPKHNKVEADNDQVRVLRFHLGPKESTPMHEHPAMVLVALTDGHTKVTSGDGTARESTRKAGDVVYRPALKHAVENLSNEEYEMIEVELKATSAAKK